MGGEDEGRERDDRGRTSGGGGAGAGEYAAGGPAGDRAGGLLAVTHDGMADRARGGRGRVGGVTMAELRRLDAGEGEGIPTLGEVLEVTRGHVQLLVELKGARTAATVASSVPAAGMTVA